MKRQPKNTILTSRRGVGAIIGGVILAAIMVTTVLVYFITILNNEKAKTSYELQAAQANQEQAAEKTSVVRDTTLASNNIKIRIDNDGSQSLIVSKLLLYCISSGCTNPEPDDSKAQFPIIPSFTLNPGESASGQVGPVSDGLTYRIDLITERGNIVSAKECKVNFGTGICENDPTGEEEEPPCLDCAVNEGIIQGTGSLQLDFKAFGALFPQLGLRDGIPQQGWDVKVTSRYGNATGYPAFDLPAELNAVIVEKVRNLDWSGEDLIVNRNTGLVVNVGKATSGQPDPNYICFADKTARTITAYDESDAAKRVIIPYTPINADRTVGWVELFFCSTTPKTDYGTNPWKPDAKFNNINGIFMIARGTFQDIFAEYAQTIPYQAVQVGKSAPGNNPSLITCIRESDINTACAGPKVDDSSASLIYFLSSGDMENPPSQGGCPATPSGYCVYIHINTLTNSPYHVTWIYPDGNFTELTAAGGAIPNGNNNIQIKIPTGDSDAGDGSTTDIGDFCSTDAVNNKVHFAIMVTDNFDSTSYRNAYYMTWRMDCP